MIAGRNTPGVYLPRFALYYSHSGSGYSLGNRVPDTVIEDGVIGDDGFSFSFQKNGVIKNITHHGSRLALYHSTGILVDGYDFTPTPGRNNWGLAVTASDHLTVNNFHAVTAQPHLMASPNGAVTRSTTFTNLLADNLSVGDVSGLVVYNSTSGVTFNPVTTAVLTVDTSDISTDHVTSKVKITWKNIPI